MDNKLLKLLRDHIQETYGTIMDNEGVKSYLKDISKQTKKALPILEHDPKNVSVNDMLNSGFGVMPMSVKGLSPTSFSKAHDTAQKNAALPIEQGGLGLHPDNTSMDRAKAMGFNTPAYHGTNSDINSFDRTNSLKQQDAGFYGEADYFTPIANKANHYADYETGGNVIPALLKTDRSYDWRANEPDGSALHIGLDKQKALNKRNDLIKKGYDSVEIRALKNDPMYDKQLTDEQYKSLHDALVGENYLKRPIPDREAIQKELLSGRYRAPYQKFYDMTNDRQPMIDEIAMFNPQNIRSRFAAFDPMKRNSGNILASLLGGTAIANNYRDNK